MGQQVLEGLAILVAIRIWHTSTGESKLQLQVRGDNIGALTRFIKIGHIQRSKR